VPLIAWAVSAYAIGLLAGFSTSISGALLLGAAATGVVALKAAHERRVAPLAAALLFATGILVARDCARRDARCADAAAARADWRTTRSHTPCDAAAESEAGIAGALVRWRERAGARIDTLYRGDAPLVRALLIADTRDIPTEVRDRFAAAGLVHILSISGLHVAIIAEAAVLLFEMARATRTRARWAACLVTVVYVAAIGAPPPAVRSAVMLVAATAARALERPVSPWAVLAVSGGAPLIQPSTAIDLGWQLSVAGFAALTAAGIFVKRRLPHTLRGWRRTLTRDLIISTLASLVTAPLVAWTFGRVSLIAPFTNLAASPIVAVLQPALFLSLAPVGTIAAFVADAAHPLLTALDTVATVGAAVPFSAIVVAPAFAVACAAGIGAVALIVAASARDAVRALSVAGGALTIMMLWPIAPSGTGLAELHMIDVGQGDALALRTPRGRWILFDAGRTWNGGDAGRSTVIPYVRRLGGDVVMFVLSHPHADHVGGAASVLRALHPAQFRDAAFAGGSESYRASLAAAHALGVSWMRVHPGDTATVDGITIKFLAPDSVWTARLTDPNLASTVATVQYGAVRFLLTGDAERAEEEWLLSRYSSVELRSDVLKVGHHGSRTSSSSRLLDAVQPRVALVSVGAGNSYGHPSAEVMDALLSRGAMVARTDQLGTVTVATDGRALFVGAGGRSWTVIPNRSTFFPPRASH
jgi:competence protein ComEC